ncbi:putative pentatricopeptide repeat-containing protein [Cardamine amara subsp. amara]|uniref:Pentatricopeptide repeat-containing protein n=1 Tax=Cardamine amara subsp. amara TaxID=228776 RepID=A0ABD1A6P5_CARAN
MISNQRQNLVKILRVCTRNGLSEQGGQVHCFLLKTGSGMNLIMSNYLIDMYCKCREPLIAYKVFDSMPERNVVSWTALMSGHVLNGDLKGSLSLFTEMGRQGVYPNEFTLSTNLKACGLLNALEKGLQIHGFCLKIGFEMMIEVGNSLLDLYSKCGRINEAEKVFIGMVDKSLISWNAMIAGFVHAGYGSRALATFGMMQEANIWERPDEFTLTSLLKACSSIGMIHGGKQIHGFLVRSGFHFPSSATITGSLVDLYVKCGNLFSARKAFDQIKEKAMISWSSLILGYAQEGDFVEAMGLFKRLRELNSQIDSFVLSSIIGVFADFALLQQGKQMQALSFKLPSGLETSVSNSVVDMYLKSGLVDEAEKCFAEMQSRDVISWTVMITGYGKHGLGKKAVSTFNTMLRHNIEPDDVCYLAVLSACSHSGLIEEGEALFSKLLETRGIKPRVEHYACVVDLLGRTGRLKEAKHLIDAMPVKPNVGIWQTLLSHCRVHGDIVLGEEVGKILLKIDGKNPANYVMMSNLYGQAGYWHEHGKARELGKIKGSKKEAGLSWVEIEREVHFFRSGEDSHPLTLRIQETLKEVERRMKEELGYVYGLKQELHDIDDESKEENLRAHSEKLAIGLALASGGLNQKGKTLRVFKNLRVCVDCHEFIKGLSKIMKIAFVVRDAVRFHSFQDGRCSCGDYW